MMDVLSRLDGRAGRAEPAGVLEGHTRLRLLPLLSDLYIHEAVGSRRSATSGHIEDEGKLSEGPQQQHVMPPRLHVAFLPEKNGSLARFFGEAAFRGQTGAHE
mmetsp:Transcript_25759/g.50430  ORF Transcript_25759/g.50430 Transcript_25759/m.50430 type:complete len:103 (-) Transcript_25759:565-873(-)